MGQAQAKEELVVRVIGLQQARQRILDTAFDMSDRDVAGVLLSSLPPMDAEIESLKQSMTEENRLQLLAISDRQQIEDARRRERALRQQKTYLAKSGIDPQKFAEKARKDAKDLDQTRRSIMAGVAAQKRAVHDAVARDKERKLEEAEEQEDAEAEDEDVRAVGGTSVEQYQRMWELAQRRRQQKQQEPGGAGGAGGVAHKKKTRDEAAVAARRE